MQDFVVGVREINYAGLSGTQTTWVKPPHRVHPRVRIRGRAGRHDLRRRPVLRVRSAQHRDRGRWHQPERREVPGVHRGDQGRPAAHLLRRTQHRRRLRRGRQGERRRRRTRSSTDRPGTASSSSRYDRQRAGVASSSFFRRAMFGSALPRSQLPAVRTPSTTTRRSCTYATRAERRGAVAPFLTLDGDPYPAVVNGRVIWILDGCTTSATYPYAQQVDLRETSSDTTSAYGFGVAGAAEHQLHPQLGQGHRGCLRRFGDPVPVR